MLAHLRRGLPTATLFNHLEAYGTFLRRGDEAHLIQNWAQHGDRSLFWAGDPKLAFVSAPVIGADLICQRWGYGGTRALAPDHPTTNLAADILREPRLLNALVSHAEPGCTLQLLPFCTTPAVHQLADRLRRESGLVVLLPESPAPENLWLRDYIDSKSGFRDLILQWLGDPRLLPFGVVCLRKEQARDVVWNFLQRGKGCVIKADLGVSGLGHLVFRPQESWSQESILDAITEDPHLNSDPILADELILSSNQLSPSLEMFVPPAGSGEPEVQHLAQQLLNNFGSFAGALISRELQEQSWYPRLREIGTTIAAKLQALGYVGFFDIDTIISDDGEMYLMEVNSRRTGSTYVHELAQFLLGDDYLKDSMVLTDHHISCPGIKTVEELLAKLDDLLFPIHSERKGTVVTVTSHIAESEFGAVFIGSSTYELLQLKELVQQRLTDDINLFRGGA